MRKKNGFTLVELLAMLVVLGILMAVTVPNISGILSNQKLNIIKSDATKMVEKAKVKTAKDTLISKPRLNECLVFSLEYLNDNEEFDTGPNGGEYEQYDSFVIYTRIGKTYKYYVRLVEKTSSGNYGFNVIDIDDINEATNDNIVEITTTLNLGEDSAVSKNKLNANKPKINGTGTTLCGASVKNYYVTQKHYCEKYHDYYYDSNGIPVSEEDYHASCG